MIQTDDKIVVINVVWTHNGRAMLESWVYRPPKHSLGDCRNLSFRRSTEKKETLPFLCLKVMIIRKKFPSYRKEP